MMEFRRKHLAHGRHLDLQNVLNIPITSSVNSEFPPEVGGEVDADLRT